jgi:hypothetical protein
VDSDSLYVVTGKLSTQGGRSLTADNVAFYLTADATVKINGNADLDLTAPTTGPFAGIVLRADQRPDANNKINGTAAAELTEGGGLYFPNSRVEFLGNAGINCSAIVADRIKFTGNTTVRCSGAGAGLGEPASWPIAIVE